MVGEPNPLLSPQPVPEQQAPFEGLPFPDLSLGDGGTSTDLPFPDLKLPGKTPKIPFLEAEDDTARMQLESSREDPAEQAKEPDAKQIELMQQELPELEDAPLFPFRADDPEGRQEALHKTQVALLDRGINISSPEDFDRFIQLSDTLTELFLQQNGLNEIVNQFAPEIKERIRGANLYNLVNFYGSLNASDLKPLSKQWGLRMAEMTASVIQSKIQQLQEDNDPAGIPALQRDLQVVQNLAENADNPQVGLYVTRALDHLARADAEGEDREAQIIGSLLNNPVRMIKDDSGEELFYSDSPFTKSLATVINRHLRLAPDGKPQPGSLPVISRRIFQGTLLNHRARRLGLPLDAIEKGEMGPEEMWLFTHPRLLEELQHVAGIAKEAIGPSQDTGDNVASPDPRGEFLDAISRGRLPGVRDALLMAGMSPFQHLARDLDFVNRTLGERFVRGVSNMFLPIIGGMMKTGKVTGQAVQSLGTARLTADELRAKLEEKERILAELRPKPGEEKIDFLSEEFQKRMEEETQSPVISAQLSRAFRLTGPEEDRTPLEEIPTERIAEELDAAAAALEAGTELQETAQNIIEATRRVRAFGLPKIRPNDPSPLDIIPASSLRDSTVPWLQNLNDLVYFLRDKSGDIKADVTKEGAEKFFGRDYNWIQMLTLMGTEQVAVDALIRNQQIGSGRDVLEAHRRETARRIRSEEFDRNLLGGTVTQEKFDEQVRAVKDAAEELGFSTTAWGRYLLEVGKLAPMVVARDTREWLEFAVDDPETFAGGFVLTAPLIPATGFIMRPFRNAMMMRQASHIVREGMRQNPDLVKQLGKTVMRMGEKPGTKAQFEAIQAMTDALDYAEKARRDVWAARSNEFPRLDLTTRQLQGIEIKAIKRAASIIKKFTPENLTELLSPFKSDRRIMRYVSNPSLWETLRNGALSSLGWRVGKRKIRPWAASAAPGPAREALRQIQNGERFNFFALPVSTEHLNPLNAPVWRRIQRFFGRSPKDVEIGAGINSLLEFDSKYAIDSLSTRLLGAEKKANLAGFLDFFDNAVFNELERNRAQHIIAQRRGLTDAASQLDNQANNLQQSLTLSNNLRRLNEGNLDDARLDAELQGIVESPLMQSTSLEQLLGFLNVNNGRRAIYERMALPGETQLDFENRMASYGYRHLDENEIARLGEEELALIPKDVTRKAEAFKRALIREFFETKGINGKRAFDEFDKALTPGQALRKIANVADNDEALEKIRKRLPDEMKPEIDKIKKARDKAIKDIEKSQADPNFVLKLPQQDLWGVGLRFREDLREMWDELKTMAKNEASNHHKAGRGGIPIFGNMVETQQMVNDGNISRTIDMPKRMSLAAHLNIEHFEQKQAFAEKFYEGLSEAEKDLFDAYLITVRDTGIDAPLEVMRKRFPRYFERIDPQTPDEAVKRLLIEEDDLRQSLLHTLAEAGEISPETHAFLSQPYATRLLDAYEYQQIFPGQGNLWKKKVAGTNINLGSLESQRHEFLHKAQIYPKNGRPITNLFESRDAAETWMRENFNVEEFVDIGEDLPTVRSQTPAGDLAVIMDPLGDLASQLGKTAIGVGAEETIRPGRQFFERMRQFMFQAFQKRYINGFNRKGVAFTNEEFQRRLAGPDGQTYDEFWEQLPDEPVWGELAGKWVPRKLSRSFAAFGDAFKIGNSIGDVLEEFAIQHGLAGNFLIGAALKGFGGINNALRWGIRTWHISTSTKTMMTQILGDGLIFAHAAGGAGNNYSALGIQNMVRAANDLWDIRTKGFLPSELPDRIKLALEHNVFDEGFYGNAQAGDTTPLFGFTARDAALLPLKNPDIQRLVRRDAFLTREINRLEDGPTRRQLVKEQLTLQRELFNNHSSTMARAWGKSMRTLRPVRRAGRAFQDKATRFYGDLGNFHRLRTFYYLMDKGLDPQSAADQVNTFMQTYSQVPSSLRRFSRSFFGSPVISFPYELQRITRNIIKRNPAFALGFMAQGAVRNGMAMMAGGINPYKAFSQMSSDGSWWSALLNSQSQQVIPLGGGNFEIANVMGLDMVRSWSENFGLNLAFERVTGEHEDGLMGRLIGMSTAVAGKFLFGPLVNWAGASLLKRNITSGKLHETWGSAFSTNAIETAKLLIPQQLPKIGRIATRVKEEINRPGRSYTGRRQGTANILLREIFGVWFSGNPRALIPKPLESLAERTARAVTMVTQLDFDPEKYPGPVILGEGELDLWDAFVAIRNMTASLDSHGGWDRTVEEDNAMNKLRRGIEMEDDELIEEAWTDLNEYKKLDKMFNGVRVQKDLTKADFLNTYSRANKKTDEQYVFDNVGLIRKTVIMSYVSNLAEDPEYPRLRKTLLNLYMTNVDSGELQRPTKMSDIEASLKVINAALTNTKSFTDVQLLRDVQGILHQFIIQKGGAMDVQDRREMDPKNLEALEAWERIFERK